MRNREADAARWGEVLRTNPRDRIAWHNLAAAEGDLGRHARSEAAARRALALGIKAPETRLVLARALLGQRRLEESRKAFEEALKLNPRYPDAHRDLAQLVWMETGDVALALGKLDGALAAYPGDPGLELVRSIVLEYAGDAARALSCVEAGLSAAPDDVALLRQAARLHARAGDTRRAWELAGRAASLAPSERMPRITLCEAALADGRPDQAEACAAALYGEDTTDQYALALLATSWRLLGDARYAVLYDYRAFVDVQRLETPPGWQSLDDWLRALAAELEGLHCFRSHPLEQSVRWGSQLPLAAAELERPVIAALFARIAVTLDRYRLRLGQGADPVRSRNTAGAEISGAWSIRLESGGHHTDHVHQGWFSSACYITVPASVAADGAHAGWLRFGKPGIPTRPTLEADHFVQPMPGRLVLFPAYMWHGVEPFEGPEARLSVAFDVVPA